jgi:mannose-1-phosphate guanylyltransferase
MDLNCTSERRKRAAIILAGGEGTRLAEVTRRDGVHVPKQFCALHGETSLLEETRRRVSLSVPTERVFFVLKRAHEQFFAPLLADVPQSNLIVQPQDRGTAPAILYSLLRLAESAPEASVLLTPSDHYIGDKRALMRYVDLAFAAVEECPRTSVLLGIAPDSPEASYGWIEPARVAGDAASKTFPVRRFWEKPPRDVARDLMGAGCLWNSMVMVGQLSALLGLFALAMPELYVAFSRIRPTLETVFEEQAVDCLYQRLRSSDFSRQVLEPAAQSMSVLPVVNLGWSDLGEPDRLAKVLSDISIRRKDTAA